jgi:hypothetical protein
VLGKRALRAYQCVNVAGGFGSLLVNCILPGDFATLLMEMATGRCRVDCAPASGVSVGAVTLSSAR